MKMDKSKIVKVTYGEESSVRISDYQYVKPRIELTAVVGDDHTFAEVLESTQVEVRDWLRKAEIEIKKRYKLQK